MKAIVNAVLVMRDHYIPDAALLIEEGRILACGERAQHARSGRMRADRRAGLVCRAGADRHTHPCQRQGLLYRRPRGRGATPPAPWHHDAFAGAVFQHGSARLSGGHRAFARGDARPRGASTFAGLYMEGPYLNPKFGCERESNPWRGAIDRQAYLPIVRAAADLARVWAAAPEREEHTPVRVRRQGA